MVETIENAPGPENAFQKWWGKVEKYSKSINMTTMSSEEFVSTVEQFNNDIARDFYKKIQPAILCLFLV
jgi:hypothetical protein